jgi:hypothetical protein
VPLSLAELAWSMNADRLAEQIVPAFRERGIRTVLLKGSTLRQLLYATHETRGYGDVDLLVDPADWQAAHALLADLGFEEALADLGHPRMESEASYAWRRGRDEVDLHTTLFGLAAPAEVVWRVLSSRTVPFRLGSIETEALAPGPRSMHVALHAAQHGWEEEGPLEDLRRAIAQVPEETWRDAADAAGALGAQGAMALGLRMFPEGARLADSLGLDERGAEHVAMRIEAVPLSEGFDELRRQPGLRAKARMVRGELFPRPAFMRWWSPLASRGRRGLAAAYVWRVVYLAWKTPRGYRAWRRARSGGSPSSSS